MSCRKNSAGSDVAGSARTVPVHYLRRNDSAWTPPSVICLDTETRWETSGDSEIHTLRLWAATFNDRRKPRTGPITESRAHGFGKTDLALTVHKWCQRRRTVWLYAHNLTFDLMTSDLLAQLADMGWEVTDFAVDSGAPFARLTRGDSHLTLCDSFSWLPKSIREIARALDMDKAPLPANDDSDAAWLERCQSDADILTRAMLTLMQWWDDQQLGHWNVTGAASGMNCMRHIPSPDRILIRPDETECNADRAAVYGGRRFCWRTGELPAGRYPEIDIERAYTTACREMPLPVQRMAHFDSLPIEHRWVTCDRHGIIAQVRIRTDSPRYPCRHDDRVWYPVGEFTTTLAGPEIAAARARGELLAIGPGWVHELGYALRPWATWILDTQQPGSDGVPDVARITLRTWGRSVVGKWAQRGWERIRLGPSPAGFWGHIDAWDHNAQVRASIVDFGGTRWQVSATGQSDNAYPAILAFVESYVRIALSAAIDVIGESCVISCDTDGLIADAFQVLGTRKQRILDNTPLNGAADPLQAVINSASSRAAPFTLRDKQTYHAVTVYGPQHLLTDTQRRLSGIPGAAELMPDGRYHAWLWPKLAWQVRHGRQGEYTRPSQHYRLAATYAPGFVLSDGAVRPVEMRAAADGTNELLRFTETRWARLGDVAADVQARAVAGYA